MADEFRLYWTDDSACLGSHCANGKPLQSLIWHDLVLLSILQHRMLPVIVFLIGDEVSTPSATAILSLNADFVRVEVGGKFEQVLIAFDGGADVRDEGDASLGQQVDDLNLIPQVTKQFRRGTPQSKSVLLTKLLSFAIDQHEYNIGIFVFTLHVCDNLRIFEQTIATEGANDALLMAMLERGRNGDKWMCSHEGVSARDHFAVGVVVVNVEQSGTVDWPHVKEMPICAFEEGQYLFYRGY